MTTCPFRRTTWFPVPLKDVTPSSGKVWAEAARTHASSLQPTDKRHRSYSSTTSFTPTQNPQTKWHPVPHNVPNHHGGGFRVITSSPWISRDTHPCVDHSCFPATGRGVESLRMGAPSAKKSSRAGRLLSSPPTKPAPMPASTPSRRPLGSAAKPSTGKKTRGRAASAPEPEQEEEEEEEEVGGGCLDS